MNALSRRLAALALAACTLLSAAGAAPALRENVPEAAGGAAAGETYTIYGYQEGVALAQSRQTGLWGYADPSGNLVIPSRYDSAVSFNLGVAQVKLNGKLGVIRRDGAYLIRPAYDTLIHAGSRVYIAQKGTRWGLVTLLPYRDERGTDTQVLYDFVYDRIEITNQNGVSVLAMGKDGRTTYLPVFELTALLKERNVPSAQFPLVRDYLPNFSDVSARAWYDQWVDIAYNLGLMKGIGGNKFDPDRAVSVAEVVRLAAHLQSRYIDDDFHLTESESWYLPSVEYCLASGILRRGEFDDYKRPITRAEAARIFARTALIREMADLNDPERIRASVPDVEGCPDAEALFAMYAKGIITGVDGNLTAQPDRTISRAEIAAAAARMARAEQRVTLF